jgi:hypothetical protein
MSSRHCVARVSGISVMTIIATVRLAQAVQSGANPPVVHPEFIVAADIVPADSDTLRPGRPAIGFDGVNYLVVSCRTIETPIGLFGVQVSTTGQVLNSFHIGSSNCSSRPAVAFDGANYLVVVRNDGQIFGTRVSPTGTVLDGPGGFAIGQASGDPAIAFDGTNYLIVWNICQESTVDPFRGHDIVGARVTPTGHVLDDPALALFVARGEQVFPSVAFDGTNYLVVWRDTRTGSGPSADTDIFGSRVSTAGVNLDPTGIAVSTAPLFQGEPHLAFDGTNYLVVWVDARNDPSPFFLDIFGTRISPAGALLDGPADTGGIAINTFPTTLKLWPRVVFNGNQYVVVWFVAGFFSPAGIYAARLSPDGSLVDGTAEESGLLIAAPSCIGCRYVFPNIHPASAITSLIGWVNNDELVDSAKDVMGAVITFESSVLDASIDIKPGDDANSIRPLSHGVIPVAILTTDTLDATTVDVSSVQFGSSGAREAHGRGHVEDVNADGRFDVVLHFRIEQTGIDCGDTTASLTGKTVDGQVFAGSDSITTRGCN